MLTLTMSSLYTDDDMNKREYKNRYGLNAKKNLREFQKLQKAER